MNYFKYENTATKKILNGTEVHPDNTPLGDGHPYLKYAFEVKFTTTGGDYGFDTDTVFLAKTCELPRWTADTQVVNVYNHKTLVQTKLTYEPITMTFYDQTNNAGDTMIWAWVQEQFDSTDGSKSPNFKPLEVEIKMKNLSAPGATDKIYKLKNAFIVDAQHDTLDYATSDPIMWSLTIRYEDLETTGYEGPTPEAEAHIKPLPKPPVTKPPEGKKEQSSSFTPITPVTKPPKADAKKEQKESDKWVEAGGTVTGGGAATGNPTMTNQTRLGNPNIRPGSLRDRVAQANAARANGETARQKDIAWPSWVPFVGKTKTETPQRGGYETPPGYQVNGTTSPTGHKWEPITHGTLTDKFSPSTGTDKTTSPTTPPTSGVLAKNNAEYIANKEKELKQETGYNTEYKKAYIEALKKNPPRTSNPQSIESAEERAHGMALKTAPRYKSDARVTDNGVSTDRGAMLSRNPANTVNDAKNANISNTQIAREQNLQKFTPATKNRGNDY